MRITSEGADLLNRNTSLYISHRVRVQDCTFITLSRLKPSLVEFVSIGKIAKMPNLEIKKQLASRRLWIEVFAEFLISAFFLSIVCGCSLSYIPPYSVTHMAISSGLGVATFAFTMWDVSCGLFNPALTIAYFVGRKKTLVQTVIYIIAQLVGSICGAAVIYGVASDQAIRESNLAVNLRNTDVSVGKAFGLEVWITLSFILVVFAVTDPDRNLTGYGPPLAIGLVVFVNLNFSIMISGGGMNPARSFGPAVVMNSWQDHWIYWLGPVIGGIVAALLYNFVFSHKALVRMSWTPNHEEHETDEIQENNYRAQPIELHHSK